MYTCYRNIPSLLNCVQVPLLLQKNYYFKKTDKLVTVSLKQGSLNSVEWEHWNGIVEWTCPQTLLWSAMQHDVATVHYTL